MSGPFCPLRFLRYSFEHPLFTWRGLLIVIWDVDFYTQACENSKGGFEFYTSTCRIHASSLLNFKPYACFATRLFKITVSFV